tara:strand:+ start:6727 stop:7377 length:651 start_codon:yes stop_codon:yes gene_type:complete
MDKPILYNYFRSSTSIRVRVALNIKGINFDYKALHLRKNEHKSEKYLKINPFGLLPTLEFPSGIKLNQSLSILEYLEEIYPSPPILPVNSIDKAKVRSLAYSIALEIHPLNNLQVLNYLRDNFSAEDIEIKKWFSNWVHKVFIPLEKLLTQDKYVGLFCFGDTPTIADICLFSQVVNNARFDIDMNNYPKINDIYNQCLLDDNFVKALPNKQPDIE